MSHSPSDNLRDPSFRSECIFGSAAAQALLTHNRVTDVDSVFSRRENVKIRHTGRAVFELGLSDYAGHVHRTFAKINWGRRRLWPRMTDLRTGQVFWSHPAREWHGLTKFEQLGLSVPQRLAFFEKGLLAFRSAVIVRAVPPADSIYDMLCSGSWSALSAEDRTCIVDEIVKTLDCIHRAGLGWRGTSTGHFYPERDAQTGWKLWLIDCEGVHTRATRQSVERDFRKIGRCLARAGADSLTLQRLRFHAEETRNIRLELPSAATKRAA